MVNTVAVIVPFYQRDAGILVRSLKSIMEQHVPDGWAVEAIVVDDGSPVAAEDEVRSLQFEEPVRVKIIRQENHGVGAARNRGLLEIDTAAVIAFLDSDDRWPVNHLERAIQAIEDGFDFYFKDNWREGHHESHCRSPFLARTLAFLDSAPQNAGLLEIPKDCMVGLTLGEFPCQASTVVFRRSINRAIRFDTDLKQSGEDVLFFATLVGAASRICFDRDGLVECGGGVNVFFSNLSWDSDKFLAITVDHLVMRLRIAERIELSVANEQWNRELLEKGRVQLAFQMLRNIVRHPLRALREIERLARMAPSALATLPLDMIRVALRRVLRAKDLDPVIYGTIPAREQLP